MMAWYADIDVMLKRFSVTMATFILMLLAASTAMGGEADGQKRFSSPQQAVEALVAALRSDNDAELLNLLGPDSEDLIASGDQVADQNGRLRFLKAYGIKNSLEQDRKNGMVLLVGSKNYPFPIPIVRQGEAWSFDTRAGMEEILNRRIGRNELHTIEVMEAYTAAQREYASIPHARSCPEFAQKFASSEGQRDGLYWEVGEGEEESPFGPLIAKASAEGYAGDLDENPPEPFHGYYFKILKGQGEHAAGGAFDYVVDGKMVLGFALIAYPAKYGASGIMTFIVNQEGVIYEKDLGEETAVTAAAITLFNPDDSWQSHEEPVSQ